MEGYLVPFAGEVGGKIEAAQYSGILVPERTKLLADKIHGWNAA